MADGPVRAVAGATTPPPAVRVGVGALILDDGSTPTRVLVGRRLNSHGAGSLALPGGHLEHGESFEECASREVLEETGIQICAAKFKLASISNDVMASEGKHYVTIFMLANLPANAVAQNLEPHKNAGWEWWTWDELLRTPADQLFIPLHNLLRSGYSFERIPKCGE